jgi:hypothetical protein
LTARFARSSFASAKFVVWRDPTFFLPFLRI